MTLENSKFHSLYICSSLTSLIPLWLDLVNEERIECTFIFYCIIQEWNLSNPFSELCQFSSP